MAALRTYRQGLRDAEIAQASTNWATYRKVKREGASSWQYEFGLDCEGEPLNTIKNHFQERFDKGNGSHIDSRLQNIAETVIAGARDTPDPI